MIPVKLTNAVVGASYQESYQLACRFIVGMLCCAMNVFLNPGIVALCYASLLGVQGEAFAQLYSSGMLPPQLPLRRKKD